MRKWMLLLLVLAVAGLASAQTRDINDVPTTVRLSSCYTCHDSDGAQGAPGIQPLYLIHTPESVFVPVGETVPFPVQIQHTWWSTELMEFVGRIDLATDALAFASDREPIVLEHPSTLQAPDPDTSDLLWFFGDRTEQIVVPVEGGVTDLTVSVEPTHAVAEARADLQLRIWTSPEARGPATFVVNDAGPGEAEQWTLSGAATIAEHGIGPWVFEVAMQDVYDGSDPVTLADQPFTLEVLQEFRASADPFQYRSDESILPDIRKDPAPRANMEWLLTAMEVPDAPTVLNITVDATGHYKHVSPATDWGRFTKTVSLHVIPAENGVIVQGSLAEAPVPVDFIAWGSIGEVIGYASSFLIIASVTTGGMFGKGSRRTMNRWFGTAKRRVAFHNFLSYGILAAAVAHTVVFIGPEQGFHWTRGIIWGGVAILAMAGLGVTGAMQVPMIRKWNYAAWRWSHFGLSLATIGFTLVHMLLDGANFGDVQRFVGWTDPFQ